jgi:hypothetical protein
VIRERPPARPHRRPYAEPDNRGGDAHRRALRTAMRPLGVGSLRPLRWSKWIAERDDVSYDEAFQPVHKALEDFKSSHDAEGEPSPIPLVRLGVDETGADRILNVSGNSSSASTKTRSRDSRQPRPQRSKTKAPSRRGDERGRVNSPRSYEIEPCEPPRWQDSPSPYRSKRGRPRPATPSLPRNRVGTAPTPASAGISRLRRPRPRRQRGRVRPSSPVSATTGPEKFGIAGALQSPLTDSNRRPPPYHGGALPAELRGRGRGF